MLKSIVVDTNLLLDDSEILFKLKNTYKKIVIPLTVIKEIDKHKNTKDLAYSARSALYNIIEFKRQHPDVLSFENGESDLSTNDLKIINTALSTGSVLATKDLSMSLLAEAKNVETILYSVVQDRIHEASSLFNIEDMPESFRYLDSYTDKDYIDFVECIVKKSKHFSIIDMCFVLIKTSDNVLIYAHNPHTQTVERIDNKPKYRKIKIDKEVSLKAQDEYQVCAIYALYNAEHVLLTGRWGSGKSLLATAYAIASVTEGKKIFITRPPIGIDHRYDIGWLPGPQPLSAKILTPTGWTTMGELHVGDFVIGDDGKPTKVTKVIPQGVKSTYTVRTNIGETRACADHIWASKDSNELKHNKPFSFRTTLELKTNIHNKNKGSRYNFTLPTCSVVDFDSDDSDLSIPSYTLGVLLGDGSFSSSISIISTDQEIVDRVSRELSGYGLRLRSTHGSIQYFIAGDYYSSKTPRQFVAYCGEEATVFQSVREASEVLGVDATTLNSRAVNSTVVDGTAFYFINNDNRWTNYLKNAIYALGLEGTKATTKFIPDIYKYSSVASREALLQGLMDTDGTIKKSTGEQSFTTTSEQLAKDVVELARSLGVPASYYMRNRVGKESVYVHNGVARTICTRNVSYEVTIPKFDNGICPFYLTRKRKYVKDPTCNRKVKVLAVDYYGEEVVQCIQVDNISKLYVTDNYIVTHNSKHDKMIEWFSGIISAMYFLYANSRGQQNDGITFDFVKEELFSSKFEIIPINAIQGLSLLEDDILIVDECQLVSIDYFSMILSRASKGSKIILMGDYNQTYDVVRPSESGLLKLCRLLPHRSLAHIDLKTSFRGEITELADMLSNKSM